LEFFSVPNVLNHPSTEVHFPPPHPSLDTPIFPPILAFTDLVRRDFRCYPRDRPPCSAFFVSLFLFSSPWFASNRPLIRRPPTSVRRASSLLSDKCPMVGSLIHTTRWFEKLNAYNNGLISARIFSNTPWPIRPVASGSTAFVCSLFVATRNVTSPDVIADPSRHCCFRACPSRCPLRTLAAGGGSACPPGAHRQPKHYPSPVKFRRPCASFSARPLGTRRLTFERLAFFFY